MENQTELQRILDLSKRLHWIKIADDGMVEIYLDNHMMQTFRACEARFWLEFVEGWGGTGNVWFLDFGIVTHSCIERYYLSRKHSDFDILYWAGQESRKIWIENQMDEKYSEHPEYKKLGGFLGFTGLLCQYAQHFNLENERFRVIGTELYFGKAKEVPLLDNASLYPFAPFRLYLSGKIDLLVDDGNSIGPMDHKTSKDFYGHNPMVLYEIQEGMTGYVFAAKMMLEKFQLPGLEARACNKIWMNFLQVKVEKTSAERFKRIPMYKNETELEMYRQRMISTASRIYQLLVNPDLKPNWNTMMCNNYMHNQCSFHPVHRQKDEESQFLILNSQFKRKEIWNPERV